MLRSLLLLALLPVALPLSVLGWKLGPEVRRG